MTTHTIARDTDIAPWVPATVFLVIAVGTTTASAERLPRSATD